MDTGYFYDPGEAGYKVWRAHLLNGFTDLHKQASIFARKTSISCYALLLHLRRRVNKQYIPPRIARNSV